MPCSVRTPAVQIVAGVLLIVATTTMPWATYKEVLTDRTIWFRGGFLAAVLVTLGAVSIMVSALSLVHPSRWTPRLHLVVGCTAVVVSVALALSKISAANHFHSLQDGGAQTSYASGAGLGIIASIVLAVTSAIVLASEYASPLTSSGVEIDAPSRS